MIRLRHLVGIAVGGIAIISCKSLSPSTQVKSLDSNAGAIAPDGTGSGSIQWDCLSRQYGASAEKNLNKQDEYCEWRQTKLPASDNKYCQFTTSMFDKDAFHLTQGDNNLQAAVTLVQSCEKDAKARLTLNPADPLLDYGVSSIDGSSFGIEKRNSDPHICNEVRQLVKSAKSLSYSIVDLDAGALTDPPLKFSAMPLMKIGSLYAAESQLPAGCGWGRKNGVIDKRFVFCRLRPGQQCGNAYGRNLKVGLQIVLSKAPAPSSLRLSDTDNTSESFFDTTGTVPLKASNERRDAVASPAPSEDDSVATLDPASDVLPPDFL